MVYIIFGSFFLETFLFFLILLIVYQYRFINTLIVVVWTITFPLLFNFLAPCFFPSFYSLSLTFHSFVVNPLLAGRFYRPKTKVLWEVKPTFVDFVSSSATKSWKKSRIFRYGLPLDFFSKGQKKTPPSPLCM